jgi:hypothetical protein
VESHGARAIGGEAPGAIRQRRFAGRWQLAAFLGAALVSPVLAMAAREWWGFLVAVAVVLVEVTALALLGVLARLGGGSDLH